jgi:Methyltransferase FkbM domain
VIQAGVGAASGLGRFSTDRGSSQNQLQKEDTSPLLVPVLALDDAGLAPPDLIKMDIEGGETNALLGARRMLREHRPIVLVALHGPEQRAACPRILRDAGLLVFDLDGKLFHGSAPSNEIYALPGPMSGFGG